MNAKAKKTLRQLQRRLSQNVGRLRAEQRKTQMGLAELADLHWRHLQKIEAGDCNVTLSTIACLASALGVDPRELVA